MDERSGVQVGCAGSRTCGLDGFRRVLLDGAKCGQRDGGYERG